MDWSFLAQAMAHMAGMVRRSRTQRENVHHEINRRRILDALRDEPGKNLAKLCGELGLRRGTAAYHLQILETVGVIASEPAGRSRHFFPPGASDHADLALLLNERTPEVVQAVLASPGIVQKDLLREIGMSRKVFRSCVRPLAANGLIQEVRNSRRRQYQPTPKLVRLWAVARPSKNIPSVSNPPLEAQT